MGRLLERRNEGKGIKANNTAIAMDCCGTSEGNRSPCDGGGGGVVHHIKRR